MRKKCLFAKIISGGQTGVDRAALDAALQLALPCGGWCPKGRRAEDGPLAFIYPLQETETRFYPERTRRNVSDSDGTLILTDGSSSRGTALTLEVAGQMDKPTLVVNLNEEPDAGIVLAWARLHGVRVLNVAGPRESENPGIYQRASQFLRALFTASAEMP
jgi:Circularly permutated YpsA SLOG family